jgi:hypothetical protein
VEDLPPPDLRDHRGRFHRIVISLAVGFALGALAWSAMFYGVGAGRAWQHGDRGAGRLIFMVSSAAFVVAYQVAHAFLKRRDFKRWQAQRVPEARATIKS